MARGSAFLPASARELGGAPDVVIVTGDAHVDHPSFGAVLIGRWLAAHGVSVGVIDQPDWHSARDFGRLGRPGLFFGVTAGCVDSLVAARTPLGGRRQRDAYTPGGGAGRRPERACIVYSNRIHEAFPGTPIVLGGIEASTRRLAHYDAWDGRVRRSILIDSGADVVAWGMAERTVIALALWIRRGRPVDELPHMPGIVFGLTHHDAGLLPPDAVWLPGFDEVAADPEAFRAAHVEIRLHSDERVLVQPHEGRLVVQTPPVAPTTGELDAIHSLPFTRLPHPSLRDEVPGLRVVQASLTAHRGCAGGCSFCALGLVQRRQVVSRSTEGIVREAAWLARQAFFDGTITDVGGPTANMYGLRCRKNGLAGSCANRRCLFPTRCKNLVVDHAPLERLIRRIKEIPRVRHVHVASGIRHDLVLAEPSFLDFLVAADAIGGQLSVAPEHASDAVLRLMGKPPFALYRRFEDLFRERTARAGRELHLVPYFITAFPGATLEDGFLLAREVLARQAYHEQIQDFTPTPLTDAACMWHTGTDLAGRPIHVARTRKERLMHRALVQHRSPRYRPHALEALSLIGRTLDDLTARAPRRRS